VTKRIIRQSTYLQPVSLPDSVAGPVGAERRIRQRQRHQVIVDGEIPSGPGDNVFVVTDAFNADPLWSDEVILKEAKQRWSARESQETAMARLFYAALDNLHLMTSGLTPDEPLCYPAPALTSFEAAYLLERIHCAPAYRPGACIRIESAEGPVSLNALGIHYHDPDTRHEP
jgi:hypothetical protein